MAISELSDLHQEALSRLEREEMSLLNWGAVDGSFNRAEAERIIELLPEIDGRAGQILDDLIDALLVVRVGDSLPKRYRTRFADTVRLLVKMRQLRRSGSWQQGRHLVADARIVHRARQFPRRFIDANEVGAQLLEAGHDKSLVERVEALIDRRQLADFQLEATVEILRALETKQTAGFVVSAATSGGKSLAFYLPAMAWIADNSRKGEPWVKALALYPRTELLKDQLTSAFASARLLDDQQRREGRPIVCVGAFYGGTPYNSKTFQVPNASTVKSWRRMPTGFVCPFIRCPKCEGEMIWTSEDLQKGLEVLQCPSSGCGYRTPNGSLRLTRDSMVESPPDILLTTTEMLNRNMSNSGYWKLFGVRTSSPRMMLLDEIHINEGVSGAQIALLIRRWRFLAHANPCVFVGLSATLAEPQRFFADLTGLNESHILSVEPAPTNLVSKGAEYLLALRSDPTTGVSTLSTTIQTLMLLRRMLDGPSKPSTGLFGQRVFAFTDKNDVLNRLFNDFGDAEGWDLFGRPNGAHIPKTLASRRAPDYQYPDFAARDADGQIWSTAQDLGHDLLRDQPLSVGRTAASDPGVEAKDVIIATSSLEVGFNDPTVGAVVQHKSPRGSASFMQRKGRAGRSEMMRPYAVVVLSDFGRDRISYLAYERLFSPTIDPIRLPVKNRFVLRMQATYATVDWIAHQVITDGRRSVNAWDLFSSSDSKLRVLQQQALSVVTEVLEGGPRRTHLRRHLEWSLGLDDAQVEALFWSAPRSLFLHVLPTLQRQLKSWTTPSLPNSPESRGKPLSEFIPQAMFNELLLPEVEIHIPAATKRDLPREENLGVSQALREFVPGKFNRRFGFSHGNESHWVAVDPRDGEAIVAVPGSSYEGEWLPDVVVRDENGMTRQIRVFRPTAIKVARAYGLKASTNAFPKWAASISAEHAMSMELPPSQWVRSLASNIEVFCHSLGSSLQICRYVTECNGRLMKERGEEVLYSTTFRSTDDQEAALGFLLDVDGIRVSLQPLVLSRITSSPVMPALLTSWLEELVSNSEAFGRANVFQRQQLLLVALGAIAKSPRSPSLGDAWNTVMSDPDLDLLRQATRDLFDNSDTGGTTEVYSEVLDLITTPRILSGIGECLARVDPSDAEFAFFVGRRYVTTFAGAFLEAMMAVIPSMTSDDVSVDIFVSEKTDGSTGLWISESEPGSAGIIEGFVAAYQEDPQRFWRLFERALDPSDLELSEARVANCLELAVNDPEIASAWADVRKKIFEGVEAYRNSIQNLFKLLTDKGVEVDHLVGSFISSRILAAGSTTDHDVIRRKLRADWVALESHYGIEFDMRSFACSWSENPSHDTVMGGKTMHPCDRHAFFANLLLLKGGAIREMHFDIPSLYGGIEKPDRLLIPTPPRTLTHVSASRGEIEEILLSAGEIALWAKMSEKQMLADLLRDFAVRPTVTDFLNLYPRLTSLMTRGGEIHCHLELVEVMR